MTDFWGEIEAPSPVVTAEQIINEQCEILREKTDGQVKAVLVKYDKPIQDTTYTLNLSEAMLGAITNSKQNVQSLLGETEGEGRITYEFAITAPRFPGYRYRAFFLQHSIAPYPLTITMESVIAKEIECETRVECKDVDEFKEKLAAIFSSKRMKSIIQSILVYQNK